MSEHRRYNQIPARTARYNAAETIRKATIHKPLGEAALKWIPPTDKEQAVEDMRPIMKGLGQ